MMVEVKLFLVHQIENDHQMGYKHLHFKNVFLVTLCLLSCYNWFIRPIVSSYSTPTRNDWKIVEIGSNDYIVELLKLWACQINAYRNYELNLWVSPKTRAYGCSVGLVGQGQSKDFKNTVKRLKGYNSQNYEWRGLNSFSWPSENFLNTWIIFEWFLEDIEFLW